MADNPRSNRPDAYGNAPPGSLQQRPGAASSATAALLARARGSVPSAGDGQSASAGIRVPTAPQLGVGRAQAGLAQPSSGINAPAVGSRAGATSSTLHASMHAEVGKGPQQQPPPAARAPSTTFFNDKLSSMQPKPNQHTLATLQHGNAQLVTPGQLSAKAPAQTPHDNPLFGNAQVCHLREITCLLSLHDELSVIGSMINAVSIPYSITGACCHSKPMLTVWLCGCRI